MKITKELLLENLDNPDELYLILVELTKFVADAYDYEFEESIYEESAAYVLPKAAKFKRGQGYNVYNYFTTCIGCCLRQAFRTKKNSEFLKAKFAAHIELTKGEQKRLDYINNS